jgi:hypothetical protein
VNALLAVGSVRFIKGTINGLSWRALGTVGGGEVLGGDSFRGARNGHDVGRRGRRRPRIGGIVEESSPPKPEVARRVTQAVDASEPTLPIPGLK